MVRLLLGGKFPWIRRERVVLPVLEAPADVHKTWVTVDGAPGWLHHHEASGWWVQMSDGRLIQTNDFQHV